MAKKRKLTKGQQRRVRANQAKRLQSRQHKATDAWAENQLGPAETGRVISRFGQHADILAPDGQTYRCHIRRTVDHLVTGDKVAWRRATGQDQGMAGVVEAVEARQNELLRPDIYDGLKPVAANIDTIFIVSAPEPPFSDQMIDRYLVAAEDSGITAKIIFNKTDRIQAHEADFIQQRLDLYRQIGYDVFSTCAKTGAGLADLRAQLAEQVSVFVGQSGVGKSSLINTLLPELKLTTATVSTQSKLGRHTTTVARWIPLANGGALIDSPGVREFGLWHMPATQIAHNFRDFDPFLGGCKFRDCRHADDPGCALQQAVADGKLDARRLANYHQIIASLTTTK